MAAGRTLTADQHFALLHLVKMSCTVFWGPERDTCREMLAGDFFRPLDTLETQLATEPPDAVAALKALVNSHDGTGALYDTLDEAYVTLFVNARGGIAAPLYQSCYGDMDNPQSTDTLMGPAALNMQQRLDTLGLVLAHSSNEPQDHLAIELEYLYFLLHQGWVENVSDALPEAVAFVKTELLEWVPRFAGQLRAAAPDSFYTLSAAILEASLNLLAEP